MEEAALAGKERMLPNQHLVITVGKLVKVHLVTLLGVHPGASRGLWTAIEKPGGYFAPEYFARAISATV
jgi:hypothetical protein